MLTKTSRDDDPNQSLSSLWSVCESIKKDNDSIREKKKKIKKNSKLL